MSVAAAAAALAQARAVSKGADEAAVYAARCVQNATTFAVAAGKLDERSSKMAAECLASAVNYAGATAAKAAEARRLANVAAAQLASELNNAGGTDGTELVEQVAAENLPRLRESWAQRLRATGLVDDDAQAAAAAAHSFSYREAVDLARKAAMSRWFGVML